MTCVRNYGFLRDSNRLRLHLYQAPAGTHFSAQRESIGRFEYTLYLTNNAFLRRIDDTIQRRDLMQKIEYLP